MRWWQLDWRAMVVVFAIFGVGGSRDGWGEWQWQCRYFIYQRWTLRE